MNAALPERRPCPVKQQRPKTGDVQIPYGESKADGRMLHISEVPSGLACKCRCPACEADLVARKGSNEHHFAHRANKSCAKAYETAIHKLAKQVIEEAHKVGLPEVRAVAGEEERLLFTEQVFELDSVTLEKGLPGMRPDIIARSGDRELLIEVAVTHFCDENKKELIRSRATSAIEIDLRRLSRDAKKAEIEAAILASANREWLYNKKRDEVEAQMVAEQQRQAEEKRARQQAEIRAKAARILKAVQTKPIRADVEKALKTVTSQEHTVRDGQLQRYLHIDVGGEAAFLAGKRWLVVLIHCLINEMRGYRAYYTAVTILKALREAGQIKKGLDGFIDKDVADVVRQTEPGFLSPYEAVEMALVQLYGRGLITKHKGAWSTSSSVAEAALEAIELAQKARSRVADVRRTLGRLILASRITVDMDAWLNTKHGDWDDCPAALAADSQWSADSVISCLGRLKRMVQGEGPLEEDLFGLPLERFRERRGAVLKAEREREEAAARRRAEAARKAAEEYARRQAEEAEAARRRQAEHDRMAIITLVQQELNDEDAQQFVDAQFSFLGDRSLAEVDGVTPEQAERLRAALATERRRINAELAKERLAADCRERLRRAAEGIYDLERADKWMNGSHPRLGRKRPWNVAVDEAGLADCLKILGVAGKRR